MLIDCVSAGPKGCGLERYKGLGWCSGRGPTRVPQNHQERAASNALLVYFQTPLYCIRETCNCHTRFVTDVTEDHTTTQAISHGIGHVDRDELFSAVTYIMWPCPERRAVIMRCLYLEIETQSCLVGNVGQGSMENRQTDLLQRVIKERARK